jgi:hypothetical protein
MSQTPLLAVSDSILWLKVILSAATLVVLYVRYRRGKTRVASPETRPFGTYVTITLAVLFSFAVFHNFGTMRGGTFVQVADMFHYYLGSKYFEEVGYFDLYNAVIVADTEQNNELARSPFYTDLRTYQNAPIQKAIDDAARVRRLFSDERWSAFKDDVDYFKRATGSPRAPGLFFLLMDHGYNGSPVSTFILGTIANIVPVYQLPLLAFLDVVLMVGMSVLVFYGFGFDIGALFSIYFCINYLNPYDFVSGGYLRYDWLFCIVVSASLLQRGRYASSAFFLTLAAMIRVFPAVLFYGVVVLAVKSFKATGKVDAKHVRFLVATAATATALFFLPATYLGSAVQPWKAFSENIGLHDDGIYVNHIGLRGIAIFEPSHLSLERFVETFKSAETDDVVKHWQNVKQAEYRRKAPYLYVAALLVLVALTVIIWKRESVLESVLWPLVLVYTASYPSHYYYAFLCLFILLFFSRPNDLSAFVPIAILLVLNIGVMVTDYFRPSPIVLYTLINLYFFACVCLILALELLAVVLGKGPLVVMASTAAPETSPLSRSERRRQARALRK